MPRLSSAHVKHVSQQENIVHVLCTMYVGPSTGHCCNSNTCEALSIALCMYIWDQLQALQPHTAQKNKPALNEIDASESLGQAEASFRSRLNLFFCAACRRNAQARLCSCDSEARLPAIQLLL